ncbi:MAG: NAD(P) transhydrogenase subunit alpha [Desulfobacteraceae bacterium]|nr:MAG: NAD(P) transhydrogenase subunit alpha [Desulfobacteraceae bacterium]
MKIAVPKAPCPDECRVALVPSLVPKLMKAGHTVMIENNAGQAAGFPNEHFQKEGARVAENRRTLLEEADAVFMVRDQSLFPSQPPAMIEPYHEGQILIGFFNPLMEIDKAKSLAQKKVSAFAMELIPRISRAQSMDALSSMAGLSGYKAVLLAANALPRIFPLMMTAAGSLAPAKVFVVGAGVTGLQACATAKRLGALVSAYDVRPVVKEQVESVGAQFIEFDLETQSAEDDKGYAVAQNDAFYARQREEMAKVLALHHVVITTAGVPGKKAPILITEEMVRGMEPHSVIVDAVADLGGNCELTEPGRTIVKYGVTIIGPVNLPSTMAYHASQLLAKNITSLFGHITDKDGGPMINLQEEITVEALLCHQGEIINARVREAAGLPPIELSPQTKK